MFELQGGGCKLNFSQRMGLRPKELPLQVDGMTDELRNCLWNYIASSANGIHDRKWKQIWRDSRIWHFKLPADRVPYHVHDCHSWIKQKFYALEWNEVYDFLEFYRRYVLLPYRDDQWERREKAKNFDDTINLLLEREFSGFRLIDGEFAPITDSNELTSIKDAIDSTDSLPNIKKHLQSAASLLSQKPEGDYRNSIKESISAVEGICKVLTGENSGGIDKAIAKLEVEICLHSQMLAGFKKLYNWTSGKEGIRHAILEESSIDLADAKYMLVICSAFVHFVVMKTELRNA